MYSLKGHPFVIDLIDNKLLSKMEIAKAKNIYLFSERGYYKLTKILDDDTAWDVIEMLIEGYFRARNVHSTSFPVATSFKERMILIELKNKLALNLGKAPTETHALLKKSLYEIGVRLGEIIPNTMLDEPLSWIDLINLPDGSVPFDD